MGKLLLFVAFICSIVWTRLVSATDTGFNMKICLYLVTLPLALAFTMIEKMVEKWQEEQFEAEIDTLFQKKREEGGEKE